jgi:ClpP class serine protease
LRTTSWWIRWWTRQKDKDGHEQDFFDGIDTTLPGLASRLGNEEKKVPWLREQLSQIQQQIAEVEHNSDSDSATSARVLLSGRRAADDLLQRVQQSSLSDDAKKLLTIELETKRNQFQQAANVALGVKLTATYDGSTRVFSRIGCDGRSGRKLP